jgi:hypothetical protein
LKPFRNRSNLCKIHIGERLNFTTLPRTLIVPPRSTMENKIT